MELLYWYRLGIPSDARETGKSEFILTIVIVVVILLFSVIGIVEFANSPAVACT